MKEEEVEVIGEIKYGSQKGLCLMTERDKISEELKQLMMNNGIVKIDVALVPKVVE